MDSYIEYTVYKDEFDVNINVSINGYEEDKEDTNKGDE